MSQGDIRPLAKPTTKQQANTKGTPPALNNAIPNTQKAPSGAKVQLPVQVMPEIRRAFKAYAAERDLSMSDLFILMWDEYRSRHP